MALAGVRMGAELRHCHNDAERATRRGAQPDGDGPRPRDVAGGMARGGGSRRRAPAQGILAPYPSEEMISWPVSSLVAMTRTGSSRSQYNELYAPADAPERRGQGSP